jgi:hypothetical protein
MVYYDDVEDVGVAEANVLLWLKGAFSVMMIYLYKVFSKMEKLVPKLYSSLW